MSHTGRYKIKLKIASGRYYTDPGVPSCWRWAEKKKKKMGRIQDLVLEFTEPHPSHLGIGSEFSHFLILGRTSLTISYLLERRSVLLFTTTEKLTHGPLSFLFCLLNSKLVHFLSSSPYRELFLGGCVHSLFLTVSF